MDKDSVTCPERRRVINNRARLAKRNRDPRWKKLKEEHAYIPGAECAHCHLHHGDLRDNGKTVVLTINHLCRWEYQNTPEAEEAYFTWNECKEVCCTTCNFMFEKGMKPCPVCGRQYIKWNETECLPCFYKSHPELKEASERRKEEFKALKKKLRDEEKERVKKWKRDHPIQREKRGALQPSQ